MFTIVAANDNAVANTEGAKQASALDILPSTIICGSILLGPFVTDQMLPPKGNGTVIAEFFAHKLYIRPALPIPGCR